MFYDTGRSVFLGLTPEGSIGKNFCGDLSFKLYECISRCPALLSRRFLRMRYLVCTVVSLSLNGTLASFPST